MATAVLKVLGAITPRMYAGSRIRIHEFLMEGGNDGSTLIHAAYQSRGTGTIIKYHRAMGHALVLMDKVNAPRLINSYIFDVVDRVAPPSDRDGLFARLLEPIERLLRALALNEELFTLPAPEMPFFNTSDVCLSPAQLQNSILYLYCVRCVNHLVIGDETLALRLRRETVTQLWRTALRPLPCNVSFNTLIVRQYFNWFIEYLVDTYAAPRGCCRWSCRTRWTVRWSTDATRWIPASASGRRRRRRCVSTRARRPTVRRWCATRSG